MNDFTDNVAKFPPIPRGPGGLFAKGGPGRPKGAKGKAAKETLNSIKSFGPAAIQKLWEAVNAGERWAVEYVLDKIVPTNSRIIEFEDVQPDDVKEALKQGDLSIAESKQIAEALAKLSELTDLQEIKERLIKLQDHVDKQG